MGMKKERLVPQFTAVETWDMEAFESWLVDQSAKGLHFRRHNALFVFFAKGTPQAVRYRLEAISPLSPTPEGEKRAQAEEMGWRYLDKMGSFSVYACDDPYAPELHTDPVTQSYTMDQVAKKLRQNAILVGILTLAMTLMVVFGFGLSPFPVYDLVTSGGTLNVFFMVLLDLYLAGHLISQTMRFLALRKRLRSGLPISHRRNYKAGAWVGIAVLALTLLTFVLSLSSLYLSLTGREEWNITPETPSPLDFHLSQIESAPAFSYTHHYVDGRDMENGVETERTLLAPTQYAIEEGGETLVNGLAVRSALDINYYDLTFPAMAEGLMGDLIYRHTVHRAYDETYTITALDYPGFDALTLASPESGDGGLLFACKGGRVVYVAYRGGADLVDALPHLAAALA